MVAQQVLVLFVLVRIRIAQPTRSMVNAMLFCFLTNVDNGTLMSGER